MLLTEEEEEELAKLKSDVDMTLVELTKTRCSVYIPGTYFKQSKTGICEYVYYQDNIRRKDGTSFNKLADKLMEITKPRDGMVATGQQAIITPDNMLFLCLSLSSQHSDIAVWRQAFEEAAHEQNLITGEIIGPRRIAYALNMKLENHGPIVTNEDYKETGKIFDFVRSDGKKYNLAECEAYFIGGRRKIYKEKMRRVRAILKARNTQ